ncbi:MAG: VCBS repeat-containing protein [Gemmatimonadaceae bacterium]
MAVVVRSRILAASIALVLLAGCKRKGESAAFELLSPNQTGVTFANTITTDDSLNVQTDVYVYNGAGVGVGDIDNDGLPDIFFAGNMVSSRLYLNKGHMRFEDITKQAGVATNRWATGVSMVDINDDGYLDIYVSVSGPHWSKGSDRKNVLFINNRNRTFTESAEKYGIADTGFTTHAAFLDYNGDGCLDLFLLNNSPQDFTRGDISTHPSGLKGETPGSHNELYRNNCNGTFTNVSEQAGITRESSFGLGVAVADLNGDGLPDIYISSDVTPNDIVYMNNGNGAFTNKRGEWLKHTSFAGMGVDIADFNNDGWPDIAQVDMQPHDLSRRKRMSGYSTYAGNQELTSRGFRIDYSVNMLQLNNGITKNGDVIFSDIASLAGIASTDWSWSPLFMDFDNDGKKDLFIGNGYPRAVNDLDYMPAAYAARRKGNNAAALKLLKDLPAYDGSNYFFHNNGDLTFTDKAKDWGLDRPSFSYGAAYADLDNDGKLDLVVNNIDAPAFIYHNVEPTDSAHHYLAIRLEGESPNKHGIGATVVITSRGQKQYLYESPFRGYMSTMDDRLHFGLGALGKADSVEVTWPDGRYQLVTTVSADRMLILKQTDATQKKSAALFATPQDRPFQPADPRHALTYKQQKGMVGDNSVQPLLPYLLSSHGPPLAVGDVNGDGLDDIFIGGAAGQPGQLFLQRKDGSFVASTQGQPWEADKAYEDWGAVFFDANGDGLPDLYVTSGGYQLPPTSPLLQDRLYINKGGGRFVRDSAALPPMLTSKSIVRAGDFNGDGRPDLFVGGRLTPRNYPYPTRSYILRNDGGHFTDVTEEVAPELVHPGGMVTDAAWIDFDGDGKLDLVTTGEWMPVEFFHNDGKRFHNVTASTHLPPMRGWWFSLAVGDFDHDGRPDLVAGNLGLNYSYAATKDAPFGIYAVNLTGGRTTDIILTQEIAGSEYPVFGMALLGREMYPLAIKFPTYGSFANASMPQILGAADLKRALHYQAEMFASMYLHNDGGGAFTASPLPNLAQIAPIKGIIATDVDGDGNLDLVVAGNLYDAEPNTPRADAGNGLWLRGDGKGHFTPVPPGQSGFLAPLDVTGLALVNTPNGKGVIIANSGDSLQTIMIRKR